MDIIFIKRQLVVNHKKAFSYFYLIFYSRRYVAQKKPIQHNSDKVIIYNAKLVENLELFQFLYRKFKSSNKR